MAKTIPKLTVELVPKTCHFSNVRTTIKPKEWDKIRFISYEAAGHVCEICSEVGKDQGFRHNLECHEIWEYDLESLTQILVGLISLCPICHQVKHIGRAMAMGREKDCFKQLAKVNDWTPAQIAEHIELAFIEYNERSQFKWDLDISILNEEPYSLNIPTIKKRVFEVKKYKKKRKRKIKKVANKRPPKKVVKKKK